MEARRSNHEWEIFSNVKCTHEFEIEGEEKVLQGHFSGWAQTEDEADRTTFIHWLTMLTGLGVRHPWNG